MLKLWCDIFALLFVFIFLFLFSFIPLFLGFFDLFQMYFFNFKIALISLVCLHHCGWKLFMNIFFSSIMGDLYSSSIHLAFNQWNSPILSIKQKVIHHYPLFIHNRHFQNCLRVLQRSTYNLTFMDFFN